LPELFETGVLSAASEQPETDPVQKQPVRNAEERVREEKGKRLRGREKGHRFAQTETEDTVV
jgi:hypothetical protein